MISTSALNSDHYKVACKYMYMNTEIDTLWRINNIQNELCRSKDMYGYIVFDVRRYFEISVLEITRVNCIVLRILNVVKRVKMLH